MTPIDAEIAGYAEVRGSFLVGVEEGVPWALTERVRPSFSIRPTERVSATAVVEAQLNQGRDNTEVLVDYLESSPAAPYLTDGCDYYPDPQNDVVSDYLSVERLFVDFDLPALDLRIGRQGVNWGSGLVYNPTDLYREVLATEPWREREGVNAVKATVPFGGRHQVQALLAADDDLSHLWSGDEDLELDDLPFSGALRLTLNAADTDFSVVGYGRTDGDWFAGVDFRGTLGVGWWLTGGFNGRKNEDEIAMEVDEVGAWTGGAGSPEVVVGVDYSFPVLEMFYVAAEYRYDGSGAAPEDYDYTSRTMAVDLPYVCSFLDTPDETRETLGVHYADAVLQLGFTRDLSLQTVGIVNLLDGTGLLVPTVGYNIGQRVKANVGAQVPFGDDGEFRPTDDNLKVVNNTFTLDFSGLLFDASLLAWVRYSF